MQEKRKKIPVNLKFYHSESTPGKLVSYVAKRNGSWVGVKEDDESPKKIVVVAMQVQHITEGVLYHAFLIPMREKEGFVAVSITPVQFYPKLEVGYHKCGDFFIRITFGNKQMVYDPNNQNHLSSDLALFRNRLKKRVDIKNLPSLLDDFDKVVNLQTIYDKD